MAQFDVHRNGGANRDAIPYLVVVQWAIFDGYKRRVVVPLVKKSYLDNITLPRFNPTFTIEGTSVVLIRWNSFPLLRTSWGKSCTILQRTGSRSSMLWMS